MGQAEALLFLDMKMLLVVLVILVAPWAKYLIHLANNGHK